MTRVGGRRPLSRTIFLSSFVGVLFLAASFYYFSYKFTSFKKIDFNEVVVYTADDRDFVPKDDYYSLIIYSASQGNIDTILKKVNKKYNILLLDIDRTQNKNIPDTLLLRAGINKILLIIRRFGIEKVPALVFLKKEKNVYKQDGPIYYF